MERTALAYFLIVLGILILALIRTYLDRKPRWQTIFRFLGGLEVTVIALLLATLIVLGCVQIFLRNFFHRGIIWADPLMRHAVLWLGCMGGAMATSRVRHISIDVFTRFLPTSLERFRDAIIFVATAIASSILGMAAARLVIDERSFGEKAFLGIDVWVLQLILPIAFFFIAYRSLVNLFLGRKAKPVDWEDVGRSGNQQVGH